MRRYPRTARSTTVAVMSRMSADSSISVPASAGVSVSAGSYCTATGSRRGSRPTRRQIASMPAKTSSGSPSGQLLARKPSARSPAVGSATRPLSHPTTAVRPSRKPSGSAMVTRIVVPSMATSASCAVEPYTPLKATARMPVAPDGSAILAEAAPSGTSHSSPVTFQYSSSWSSKNRSPFCAR